MSGERITFAAPLPPAMIRSNSRSHWALRVKVKQAYSEDVHLGAVASFSDWVTARIKFPWERARVTFTWRACQLPDQANVVPNCKALLDILCMAPTSTQRNDTTYLGLIEDDKGVEAIGKVARVRHRVDECVVVEVERAEVSDDGG